MMTLQLVWKEQQLTPFTELSCAAAEVLAAQTSKTKFVMQIKRLAASSQIFLPGKHEQKFGSAMIVHFSRQRKIITVVLLNETKTKKEAMDGPTICCKNYHSVV